MSSPKTIHQACRDGDIVAVRECVEADPASVDADDQHGWRPVFHAALMQHTEVVRLLIRAGADLAAHDGDVLHYAAEVPGNQEIVTLLVQYGALAAHVRPNDDLASQLFTAIFLADAWRVHALLSRYPGLAAEPDGRGHQPIHHAARNGATEIVQVLLDSGVDVNATTDRGHTVLYCAAGHGHIETVRLLLGHGVDVSASFTADGKNVAEWLAQYPGDRRLKAVSDLLATERS